MATAAAAQRRPGYDPELFEALVAMRAPKSYTIETLVGLRPMLAPTAEMALAEHSNLTHTERTIDGPESPLILSILHPSGTPAPPNGHACIYNVHGGGKVAGNRFMGLDMVIAWAEQNNAVVVSVEYRLAPEHQHPAAVEDCYAGLAWTMAHAAELNVDASRVVLTGSSAGGGVAAGVALLARDRATMPSPLLGLMLQFPMLDDRSTTVSSHQYVDDGSWTRDSNIVGWTALLGDRVAGTDEQVDIYAAPARAKDLSGLPPTYIDVGTAEVFRDEVVAFASKLWESGVQAELHVWPGGFHGFPNFAPLAALSKEAIRASDAGMKRLLRA